HFLHGAMRVVEISSVLMDSEVIGERFTRLNHRLADERHAVHGNRYLQTMPVDRSIFRQLIFENNANVIAFCNLNSRTRHTTVIAPDSDHLCWRHPSGRQELASHYLCCQ